MRPYQTPPATVEPDPFPAPSEEKLARRVAASARRLVGTVRTAKMAREAFPTMSTVTDDAVMRSFVRLSDAVDEWERTRKGMR